jgi:hypothetical protein
MLSNEQARQIKTIYSKYHAGSIVPEDALDKLEQVINNLSDTTCRCEDRPCCSCDGDVYQPAGSIYDLNDPNNYDPEEHFARMEQSGDDYCTKCGEEWTDEDNEDDVVQGFHSACAEDGE